MSDTPETDQAFDDLKTITIGSTLPEILGALEKCNISGRRKFKDLERQRDEARNEAQAFRDAIQNCQWPKHRFSWEAEKQTTA
jgi:hypothetical protein